MAAFNALGTWGAIFLLHQFRGLQVSFGLQGSREPRLDIDVLSSEVIEISIHKALASLDEDSGNSSSGEGISIHKALASLDTHICTDGLVSSISIHKALASLDISCLCFTCNPLISIHKALASLDGPRHRDKALVLNFNPQGSREPRRSAISSLTDSSGFQSTRLSRASTAIFNQLMPSM